MAGRPVVRADIDPGDALEAFRHPYALRVVTEATIARVGRTT